MKDLTEFLAYAIVVEDEAARRFDELADTMQSYGNAPVQAFFRKMAEFSRLHLAEARARSGFHDRAALAAVVVDWPDGESPEAADWWGIDGLTSVEHALQVALEGEKRSRDFYAQIAATTTDPEIRIMAEEFVEEESDHVAQLERWVARRGQPEAA